MNPERNAAGPVGPATPSTPYVKAWAEGRRAAELAHDTKQLAALLDATAADNNRLRADRDRYRDVAQAAEAVVSHWGRVPKCSQRYQLTRVDLEDALAAAVRALASTTEQGSSDEL